jgi:hypothetical protein
MEEIPSQPSSAGPRCLWGPCIRLKVLLALLALTLVGGARFVFLDNHETKWLILNFGYWLIAGTTALYGLFLWKRLGTVDWSKECWKIHRIGLASIGVCALFLQVHEQRGYKVLFDEFAIEGVARNMHFDHEASYSTSAHYFNGHLFMFDSSVDKRPFFFAFLLSLVHDLTGYREANAFYLNAALATILLALIYLLGFRLGGVRAGCLGVFLFTGLPLLAQNATGGGFELLNLVMICALLLTAADYLKSPETEGLDLLVLTAVLLSQARYESILYTLVVPAVMLCKWLRTRHAGLTWFSAVSPSLMFPPLLVNKVFLDQPAFFQTKPGGDAFSLVNLPDNLAHAVYYLFDPNLNSTNSLLLSSAGIIALVFLIVLLVRNFARGSNLRTNDVVLALVLLIVLANTALTQCYFWGYWDDPMVSRFSLPFQLMMALAILRVLQEFWIRRPIPRQVLFVAGAWIVFMAAPSAARRYSSDSNVTCREYAWFHDYLATKSPTETLSVAASSLGPLLQNYPAIPFIRAQIYKWQLKACLEGQFYREILVLQRFKIDEKTGKLVETGSSHLGDGFVLQTLAETHFRPNVVSRISRLIDVKGDLKPPPHFDEEKFPFADDDALVEHLLKKLP